MTEAQRARADRGPTVTEAGAEECPAPVASVLSAIGHTPLVRLRRLSPSGRVRFFGKLEALNPGGSIKDRVARAIVENGLRDGSIPPDAVIIEQSSGNMGVGLAQVCCYHGLRFICVVDSRTTAQNMRVLRAYGAEVEVVERPDPKTGEFLPAKLQRIRELLSAIDGSVWPDQYRHASNPQTHRTTTMREIAIALDREVTHLFVGVSTCGTLRGCWSYIRDEGLDTRIVAVDAVGSRISGEDSTTRRLPGLGTAIDPPFYEPDLVEECVAVTDRDCVAGCRWLARHEGILAGGSSGGVVAAAHRYRERLAVGATCVLVLPDRGDRYLDTIYDPGWVDEHLGPVGEL